MTSLGQDMTSSGQDMTSPEQEVTSDDENVDETFYDYDTDQFVASHSYRAQGEQQVWLTWASRGGCITRGQGVGVV